MIRALTAMLARLNRLYQPLDLRFIDAAVLLHISENPGASQSELCRLLDIASANMVPIMARLVRKRLLVRERTDGRTFGLYLGPAGTDVIAAVQRLRDEHEDWIESLLGPLNAEQVSAFFLRMTQAAGTDETAANA